MKKHNHSKGQILPLVAVTMLVLASCALLVWNIGIIEYNRQRAQTAADSAALSSMRRRCEIYNQISTINSALHLLVSSIPPGFMTHNFPNSLVTNLIETNLVGAYQAMQAVQNGLNQSAGGSTIWAGMAVAKENGKSTLHPGGFSSIYTYIGMRGMGLRQRNMRFTRFRLVTVPVIGVIPVPVGIFRARPAYYCRTWEPSLRRAQPTQEMLWTVFMDMSKDVFNIPWLSLGKPGRVTATAQAKMYLNVRENTNPFFHNGGFPRNRNEGIYGLGLEPAGLWPQFDACLVPVRGGILQH